MTKGFGHEVQQVAKGIHKIRLGRWLPVKRDGAVNGDWLNKEEELCQRGCHTSSGRKRA